MASHSTFRLMALAAALAGLDQGAKAGVRASMEPGAGVELIRGVLAVVYAPNLRGVSWWVPDVPPWFVTGLTMALVLILVAAFPVHRFHARHQRDSAAAAVAAVLLAAAAAGHLLDEVFGSFTLDWIRLFGLPAFNLADLYAYGGLVALTVELGRGVRETRGLGLRERLARARDARRAFLRFLAGGLRPEQPRGASAPPVRDLAEADCPLYFVCLEDWSAEMREAGDHKAEWYREKRGRGLRVKLARDADGAVARMIQYLPVEEAPQVEGRGAYFVLCIWVHNHRQGVGNRRGRGLARRGGSGRLPSWRHRNGGLGHDTPGLDAGPLVPQTRVPAGGAGWDGDAGLEAVRVRRRAAPLGPAVPGRGARTRAGARDGVRKRMVPRAEPGRRAGAPGGPGAGGRRGLRAREHTSPGGA
jgi:lipoprotein signal peptidase